MVAQKKIELASQSQIKLIVNEQHYQCDALQVSQLSMNDDFCLSITVVSNGTVDCHRLMKQWAKCSLFHEGDVAYFNGFIERINCSQVIDGQSYYQLEIISELRRLKSERNKRSFHHMKATNIIRCLLDSNNVSHYTMSDSIECPNIDFVQQNGESDFELMQQLCCDYGIAYRFEFNQDSYQLVFDNKRDNIHQLLLNASNGALASKSTASSYTIIQPLQQQIDSLKKLIEVKTEQLGIQLGDRVELHSGLNDTHCYRVIAMNAMINQGQRLLGSNSPEQNINYHCHLQLLPIEIDYTPSLIANSTHTIESRSPHKLAVNGGLSVATITYANRLTGVDEHGDYGVDLLMHEKINSSKAPEKPIRLLQANASCEQGMHIPLHAGTKVLVGYQAASLNPPIVLSSFSHLNAKTPVTGDNSSQVVLRTYSGHSLVMDDDMSSVDLYTFKQLNALSLTGDNKQINLISKQGAMSLMAQKELSFISGLDHSQSNKQLDEVTEKKHAIYCQSHSKKTAGVFDLNCGKNYQLDLKKDLVNHSKKVINEKANSYHQRHQSMIYRITKVTYCKTSRLTMKVTDTLNCCLDDESIQLHLTQVAFKACAIEAKASNVTVITSGAVN